MAESGGEDALLPRVLLGMMQAQEDTNKRMEELHAQSAELVKTVGESVDSARKESAAAEEKTAAALARLDKKASWGVGLATAILVVALITVALVVWKNFT